MRDFRWSLWSARVGAFGAIGLLLLLVFYQGVREIRGGVDLAEGALAPRLAAPKLKGGTFSLEQVRGKVVAIDFWASWCGPCREELPDLVNLAAELEDKGLVFVAADRTETDPIEQVEAFIAGHLPGLAKVGTVVLADEATFQRYGVSVIPTLVLIDRDGKLAGAYAGMTPPWLIRKRIERLLANAPSPRPPG